MSRRSRLIVLAALAALALGCASAGGSGAKKPVVRPPELLSRTRPDLVPVRVTPNAPRPTTVVELEVQVKPDGTPDLDTLKISGQGAGENRAAVTTWVQGLRFKPATQDGLPVVGTYKQSFEMMARTTIVR